MMDFRYFLLDISEDGIALFTVNRQDKMNAMNAEAWQEMASFFTWASATPQIRAVILTGAGDKAFIAGADLNSLAVKSPADCFNNIAQEASRQVYNCAKPVVAAINGFAFGGGCETAVACDFRIVTDTAVFALPETSLGILPSGGGTQRLSRLIGLSRTKEMLLLGRQIDANEAVRIGLAVECVPQEALLDTAYKMCRKMIKRGPLALQAAKKLANVSHACSEDVGQLLEYFALSALCGTEDKAEGVSAFLEKRKPTYTGH